MELCDRRRRLEMTFHPALREPGARLGGGQRCELQRRHRPAGPKRRGVKLAERLIGGDEDQRPGSPGRAGRGDVEQAGEPRPTSAGAAMPSSSPASSRTKRRQRSTGSRARSAAPRLHRHRGRGLGAARQDLQHVGGIAAEQALGVGDVVQVAPLVPLATERPKRPSLAGARETVPEGEATGQGVAGGLGEELDETLAHGAGVVGLDLGETRQGEPPPARLRCGPNKPSPGPPDQKATATRVSRGRRSTRIAAASDSASSRACAACAAATETSKAPPRRRSRTGSSSSVRSSASRTPLPIDARLNRLAKPFGVLEGQGSRPRARRGRSRPRSGLGPAPRARTALWADRWALREPSIGSRRSRGRSPGHYLCVDVLM